MRQVASGFALGSLSISLLIVPLLMVALNNAPDYTSAVETVIVRSGIVAPLQEAAAQLAAYRDQVMRPYTQYARHGLFPRIP